jgi:hypothetical protein
MRTRPSARELDATKELLATLETRVPDAAAGIARRAMDGQLTPVALAAAAIVAVPVLAPWYLRHNEEDDQYRLTSLI